MPLAVSRNGAIMRLGAVVHGVLFVWLALNFMVPFFTKNLLHSILRSMIIESYPTICLTFMEGCHNVSRERWFVPS